MAVDPSWESVVKQLTGFDGGTRANVAAVGGADAKTGTGSEWMRVRVEKVSKTGVSDDRNTTGEVGAGETPERVIQFYGPSDGQSSTYLDVYKVTISLPWSSSSGADWSSTGNAGAYDWGYGKALEALRDTFTTEGFGGGYDHTPAVVTADAINLKEFSPIAEAFNRVVDYFSTKSVDLEKWVKQLDSEFSSYQGSGADVFRDLIDAVSLGYKDFLTLIAPGTGAVQPGGGREFKSNKDYRSRSVVGDKLVDAELAIWTAANELATAWNGWLNNSDPAVQTAVESAYAGLRARPANVWLGTSHLDALLDDLALWLNENNILKMRQDYGNNKPGDGFLHIHPVYGNLTLDSDWKNLATRACTNWLATLAPLDQAASKAMLELNQAMVGMNSDSSFPFKAGAGSLKEANASDEAGRAKEEAEKEKEDAQKEMDKANKDLDAGGGAGDVDPPPQIGENETGGEFGGGGAGGDLGLNGGNTGAGGSGGGGTGIVPPPTLGLNGTGGGSGPGGVNLPITHPDGSTSLVNPDGSTTTTYPDGHKETTPAGVVPPPLSPNVTGGSSSGGYPVRTVKGPDGSTTSYNVDGSRTTTHKDGTTTTVNPDGTSVTNNPDGSKTVLNKDGSETITYQDGTKATIGPDGTTVTQYPDGTSTKLAPNGVLTSTDAHGNSTTSHPAPGSTVKNADGSSTVYGKDGTTTTTHEDGTKTSVSANGTVTTVDPDGTRTVSHLGKGTSTVQYADGSVSQVGKDGTVSTTYQDGSTTKLGPDGTYTTTDADGHKRTEHLNTVGGNGTQTRTTHNADGSSTTTYPDGTVDKTLKNGGHRISYPDGRTVTTDAYGRTTGTTGGTGGLGPNKSGGGLSDFDYYDYPDGGSATSPLSGSGYGYSGTDTGGAGRLPLNPLGSQGLMPGGGTGASAGAAGTGLGGERARAMAAGEASAARNGKSAQLAAEEAATAGRRPSTTSSSGTPMMPPMGGGTGGAGGSTQSDERERSTWVSEDEETWGTDEGGVAAVIGR